MNAWKVILATLVLFGTGVVTGGLLVQHSMQARLLHPPRLQPVVRQNPASAGGMRYEFLRRMGRDLDLTPDQQARIDKILSESQDQTRKMIHEEFQHTKAAFRDVLTPEQQSKFDELVKRSQRAHEQRRTSGERPPQTAPATNSP